MKHGYDKLQHPEEESKPQAKNTQKALKKAAKKIAKRVKWLVIGDLDPYAQNNSSSSADSRTRSVYASAAGFVGGHYL